MALADKFRLLSPFNVEREIGGETFRFYPCRVRTAARMAGLLSKLAGHFSVLLGSSERDQGKIVEDYVENDGLTVAKTHIQPINPDLAKMRAEQRQAAVEGAVQALLSEQHRRQLAELIVDSLRDDFERGKNHQDAVEQFENYDLPTFVEFLRGFAEANAKVFGDLGKDIGQAVRERAAELLGRGEESASSSNSSNSSESPAMAG